jgi:sugar phosphate isomerase/epimerase
VRACQAGARQKGYGGIEMLAAFSEANILASQGMSARSEAIDCFRRTIEIAKRLEATPMQGIAGAALGKVLADAGRTADAKDELMQALAVFEGAKMTVQTERVRASLSKFSGV